MPLSDNRQFRTERQDDRWQLLLGPLKDIGLFVEVVLQRGHSGTPVRMLFVRIVFVEEHDLWIIQAPPQLIGVSEDGAKPIKKRPESRVPTRKFLAPDPLLTRRLWLST